MSSIHGGAWDDNPNFARASYRSGDHPSIRYYDTGFRCVRGASLAHRSIRGGSWCRNPNYARASNRYYFDPSLRRYNIGFRCVRRVAQ